MNSLQLRPRITQPRIPYLPDSEESTVGTGWALGSGQWTGIISCTSIMPHVTACAMLLMSRADWGAEKEGFKIASSLTSFSGGRIFSPTQVSDRLDSSLHATSSTGQMPTLAITSDFLRRRLVMFFVPVYLKVFLSESLQPTTDPSDLSNSLDSAGRSLRRWERNSSASGKERSSFRPSVRPSTVFGSDDSFSSRYPIIRLFTLRVGGLHGESPSQGRVALED